MDVRKAAFSAEYDAVIENIAVVTDNLDEVLDSMDCPLKVRMQIDVALDEILSNVSFYAYDDDEHKGRGKVGIAVYEETSPAGVTIQFSDNGIPYDPLAKEDPDVTLSAEERKIGGLGIYMVKNMMDAMHYEYKDNKNVLTITKLF